MTEITVDSLLKNGFEVEFNGKGIIRLKRYINGGWSILYIFKEGVMSSSRLMPDELYDYPGFDLSRFKYIEQIDNLVNAMLGR